MASAKVDRLGRAISILEATLKATELVNNSKKNVSVEKERGACTELREIIVANDFNSMYREDRRYSDVVAKAVEVMFRMMKHHDQTVRGFAEESLDTVFRALLLDFNHSRVVVLLITEVNRNGDARSLVAAFTRLSQLLCFSKTARLISYGIHVVNAMTTMLKRPEESVQQALVQNTKAVFDVIGPRLRELHNEHAFELYRVAANNMDLTGSANRAAVVVISQLSRYYTSVFHKAFARCLLNIRNANDKEHRSRLVGSLNTVKGIWSLIVENAKSFSDDSLKMLLCSISCCLYSNHSEVLVSALEVLERIFSEPLSLMYSFVPADFVLRTHVESKLIELNRASCNNSPSLVNKFASLHSSPLGSVLDMSTGTISPNPFNSPLELPTDDMDSSSSSDGTTTPCESDGQVIDPLLHADLYEEVSRADEASSSPVPQCSTPVGMESGIPAVPPAGVCHENANVFVYVATLLGKRLLLAGLKGLKNDREVRISHKILALNCQATIAKHVDLSKTVVLFSDTEQLLLEAVRFVLHEDDQLCASAVHFIFAVDRWRPGFTGNVASYLRVVTAFQPIRKRAMLQVATGEQFLLSSMGILESVVNLAVSEVNSAFFLIQVSCAEFISTLKWKCLPFEFRDAWQEKCLDAFFQLLFSKDQKVRQAAVLSFPTLVRNSDLSEYCDTFSTELPDEPLAFGAKPLPPILNLPSAYRFRNENVDYVADSNLELILERLSMFATQDFENRSISYCAALEVLMDTYPPTVYCETWGCLNKQYSSSGYLSVVVDMCESTLNTPSALSSGLRVLGALFAGQCESQMMAVAREQLVVARTALPALPDGPIFDRIVLIITRTLNMFYSLVAEHRAAMHVSSASLLSRPSLSPLAAKKHPSRIADISRLLGTNVHPTKQTSFLESDSIHHMFSSVQGAFVNFLGGVEPSREEKFVGLLRDTIDCLCTICEMTTFSRIRPLLDEILLYVKVLFHFCPEHAASLLHQLFKVVFGTNAANINLNVLHSMKMKDPLPPTSDAEMYYMRYTNEFTLFSAFIGRYEFVSNFVTREMGWLHKDMISKIHNPPTSEIASALELFEGFITQLRQVYNAFQSVECKRAILNVMCELPRDGIIYSMADPKKVLLDSVLLQIHDPSTGNKELLRDISQFLIVLARTSVISFDSVLKGEADLIDKANSKNASEILESCRVILLEALYVRKCDISVLYEVLRSRFLHLIQYACEPALHIWTLLLHSAKNDEQRWCEYSLDFFSSFSEYISTEDCLPTYSFNVAVAALAAVSPSIFRPVDGIFRLIEQCFEREIRSSDGYWRRIVPLLFTLFNNVSEDSLLLRLEQLVPDHTIWLSSKVGRLIQDGMDALFCDDFPRTYFIMLLQTVTGLFKAEGYKVFRAGLSDSLSSSILPPRVALECGDVLSQWLQLMKYCKADQSHVGEILGSIPDDCHSRRLCLLFCPSEENQYQNNGEEFHGPHLVDRPSTPSAVAVGDLFTFLKRVFSVASNCTKRNLFSSLLEVETQNLYYIYEVVPVSHRRVFIVNLLDVMSSYLNEKSVDVSTQKSSVEQCQEVLDVVSDLVEIEQGCSREHVILLLSVLGKVDQLCSAHNVSWREFRMNELSSIFEVLADISESLPSDELLQGVVFIFRSPAAREDFIREPYRFLPQLQHILSKICGIVRRMYSIKYETYSSNENFSINVMDKVDLNMGCEDNGGFTGILRLLFDDVQYIISVLRSHSSDSSQPLFLFMQALFRHPVFHAFAVVPLTALRMNWNLRVDVRASCVLVPLVNIHLLCNLDVLADFAWRISWIGWTTRQQFEDFWMSLFGVLSSTPTGSEITAENSAHHAEQILASSCAVSSLTDLLLYTLLFPEPGNVTNGTFIMKHREKDKLFYKSKAIEQLRILEAALTNDPQAFTVFGRNIERLQYKGDIYNLGQLSALSLWTLTGDLKTGGSKPVKANSQMRISLSEYLLKSAGELDTASSVRALFENYSHWFSRGLDFLPLPLLSATVRSMALLSDLFDETQSYEFLYVQMKNVFRGGHLADHADIGYVVYSLLKAVTVVGIESVERTMTEADVAKQILTWIEAGLGSHFAFAKEATLHGVIYLLQSMASESLKPVFHYLSSFLLAEVECQLAVSDPINVPETVGSVEYIHLLWTIAFELMEEPHQVKFKNALNQKLCEVYGTLNLAPSLLLLITAGVEHLIIQSAVYSEQFLEMVLNSFRNYSTLNNIFPYALRIFVVCVFRDEVDPRRSNYKKFEPHLEEIASIYRRSDVRDSKSISLVFPSVLSRLYAEDVVLSKLLELCGSVVADHPDNVIFSLNMIFEFFSRLRDTQRLSTLVEFLKLVKVKADALSSFSERDRAIATCLLVAASSSSDIAARFQCYTDRLSDEVSTEEYLSLSNRVCEDLG